MDKRGWIAVTILLGFFGVLIALILSNIDESRIRVVDLALGSLIYLVSMVVAYYFGKSR